MRTAALVVASSLMMAWAAVAEEPWTLERALVEGLARNPDARLAQQRIVVAQAELAKAEAAFWPRLSVQSSYVRTDNPMQVFGSILNQRAYSPLDFNDVPDTDNLNVQGLLTVPLYAGGRNQATHRAAKAITRASRLDQDAVRNALSFEIARAFHNVRQTLAFIQAAEATVNAFTQNVAVASKRLEGGTLLRSDFLDLQVRLAQSREDLIRARNAHALAKRVLRNLLGIEEGDLTVADQAPDVRAPAGSDVAARTEIAAAQLRQRAAQDQIRAAKSGYLPRVSAFGSLDYDHGWRFDRGGGSYTGGALVQWDLWDGQWTRAKVREAEAQLEMAREEERKLRLALDLEAEQARLDVDTAKERLKVTEQAIALASESAQLVRARFEQGMALSTGVIDAETALLTARVRRAEAEAGQRIAIAALRKALGLPQLDNLVRPKNP